VKVIVAFSVLVGHQKGTWLVKTPIPKIPNNSPSMGTELNFGNYKLILSLGNSASQTKANTHTILMAIFQLNLG